MGLSDMFNHKPSSSIQNQQMTEQACASSRKVKPGISVLREPAKCTFLGRRDFELHSWVYRDTISAHMLTDQ